ncbi:MAG: protein kinase [Myxococcota bacterium]|nr:protein kinase [Myxococcota bacterium]
MGPTSGSHAARLQPGFQLGDYRLGQPLWSMRIADAYKAEGPQGPATVYVVHAKIAAVPEVRDHIIAGTRAAAQLPEHKHLVRTLAAGLTGDILWIATEDVDGSNVRDMLSKKRLAGHAGLGTRAAGNLIAGVAAALGEAHHGALADESVVVNRQGRVRVTDLALGPGTAAAMVAGLIPPQSSMAPELLAGGAINGAADVYGVGALLYEVLVGKPLERGGPRPSDVVNGVNTQIDEVVARACHRDPDKRFGRADVLGEVVTEALTKGGAVQTQMVALLDKADLDTGPKPKEPQVSLAASMNNAPAVSGANIDRALATALADNNEKWLVSKGRLDYGPFSLQDVVDQIEAGTIVAGNIIMDKDTGSRVDVGEHPMLGPLVDAAKQKRDDARRAHAEVQVAKSHVKKGAFLYGVIGLGVAGAVLAVYFVIQAVSKEEKQNIGGVSGIEGASLKVSVSVPKKPPPVKRSGGGGGRNSGGGNYTQGKEDLSLDMSDDGDEGSETLDMGEVYKVYSRYGGQLGGCLQSSGESSANIYINIDGPSGKVQFVKINGKQAGGLFGCMNGVLRRMKFPSIRGPRTRAEFDISM